MTPESITRTTSISSVARVLSGTLMLLALGVWTPTPAALAEGDGGQCPSGCRAQPRTLWPPNHRFVSIDIVCPNAAVSNVDILSIRQDEAVRQVGRGSGNTCPDARILIDEETAEETARVRAEREGVGNGRLYFINFTADVGGQDECQGTVRVCVPHDQGQGNTCVDSGPRFNSLQCP